MDSSSYTKNRGEAIIYYKFVGLRLLERLTLERDTEAGVGGWFITLVPFLVVSIALHKSLAPKSIIFRVRQGEDPSII
jgi:hypothetical protein